VNSKKVIFIINLLQDVNILRPLVYLASKDLKLPTEIIVTEGFSERDTDRKWRDEITNMLADTRALVFWVKDDFEAYKVLEGKAGMLFAASESDLSAHAPTHNLFKMAPSGLIKVTLQHGFECVGFLQSKQHIIAHGENITFGADVVCGWSEFERLTSMADSQKSKLLVTGPTSAIQKPCKTNKKPYGLICENLHSVRLSASGDLKIDFIEMFKKFSLQMGKRKAKVALRPHPGGQYIVKNKIEIADNVELNNEPMYKVDLSQYAYGVSAPSSVIIDMILADIPVAVWRDDNGVMDTGNYRGLAQVSNVENLLEFVQEASRNPAKFIERQHAFLKRSGLKTEPRFVYQQYRSLIESACKTSIVPLTGPTASPIERIMYVANDYIPTLQLSFIKPLEALVENGKVVSDLITETQMGKAFHKLESSVLSVQALQTQLENFQPSVIVFCRYSGPNAVFIRLWAKQHHVPVIFHIDDDLMHIPMSLGLAKFKNHNNPKRIKTVRYLLDNSDLVYCSTLPLAERFAQLGTKAPIHVAKFYCSGSVIVPAINRTVKKMGYMGFDHEHDLNTMIEAVEQVMVKNNDLIFEMFGSIPKPKILEKFGSRVVMIEPIRNYKLFLETFAELGWDIGICPLAVANFNLLKANTKWVEYTSIGAAVVASKGTVYDSCTADDCGLVVESVNDWAEQLNRLVNDPSARFNLVKNAQSKLETSFSPKQLTEQVLNVFDAAKNNISHI
jgi:glycosyltransferase involved in cell wall biosynthesis